MILKEVSEAEEEEAAADTRTVWPQVYFAVIRFGLKL